MNQAQEQQDVAALDQMTEPRKASSEVGAPQALRLPGHATPRQLPGMLGRADGASAVRMLAGLQSGAGNRAVQRALAPSPQQPVQRADDAHVGHEHEDEAAPVQTVPVQRFFGPLAGMMGGGMPQMPQMPGMPGGLGGMMGGMPQMPGMPGGLGGMMGGMPGMPGGAGGLGGMMGGLGGMIPGMGGMMGGLGGMIPGMGGGGAGGGLGGMLGGLGGMLGGLFGRR